MDINKMTDTLEPEETGFHLRTPKVPPMMASIDEDVEKSLLADQDDVGSGIDLIVRCFSMLQKASTSHSERVTPSSRSSRSSDHRRSRDDSPEYDRREGRDVSLRYSDDRDYSGRSELSPRHGRDNRHYNIKRSRYETSRTPGIAQV
ncbi:hypothetical protein Tco_1027843 [Tanacetum coccineum]